MSTLIEERRAAQSLLGLMCLEAREGPLNAPPAASSLLPGCFVPPLSNPRGSVLRTVGPSFDPTHAALVQDPRSNLAAPTPVGQLMPDPASSGYEGSLLEGLRLGDFGGRVGLLPGLRPKFMEQYAPPNELAERKRRAPREDLTGFTAEEKVARRNERARIYTHQARERQEEQQRRLEVHVREFRAFEALVEAAPRMGMLVLRADLHAVVLYASKPLERLLGLRHEQMLGEALWAHMHPSDRGHVAAALGDLILTLMAPKRALSCRLRRSGLVAGPALAAEGEVQGKRKRKEQRGGQGKQGESSATSVVTVTEGGTEYVRVRLNMRNGTQGIVVSVWPEAQW